MPTATIFTPSFFLEYVQHETFVSRAIVQLYRIQPTVEATEQFLRQAPPLFAHLIGSDKEAAPLLLFRGNTSGFFLNSFFKTTTIQENATAEQNSTKRSAILFSEKEQGIHPGGFIPIHYTILQNYYVLLPQHRILRSALLFFQKNNNNDERLYYIHSVTFIAHHILLQKKDFRKSNHFPNKNIPSKTSKTSKIPTPVLQK